jgi:hypothetical protein
MLSAIIDAGVTILDFLVSESTEQDGKWDTSGEPPAHPELLDHSFFDVIGDAYMSYLHPAIHGFGVPADRQERGARNFNRAYARYAEYLLGRIEEWCADRTKIIMEKDRELVQHLHVLDCLPDRLEAVLSHELFVGSDAGMDLPTNAPILCSYFLTDITGFLSLHVGSVMEVFRMLDPFFCDAINTKHSLDAYSLLVNWVQREDPEVNAKQVIYKVLCLILTPLYIFAQFSRRSSQSYSNIGPMA